MSGVDEVVDFTGLLKACRDAREASAQAESERSRVVNAAADHVLAALPAALFHAFQTKSTDSRVRVKLPADRVDLNAADVAEELNRRMSIDRGYVAGWARDAGGVGIELDALVRALERGAAQLQEFDEDGSRDASASKSGRRARRGESDEADV